MPSLEDDIARIAALRRLSPEAVSAARNRGKAARVNQEQAEKRFALAMIFTPFPGGTIKDQMVAFDRLPERSRAFLTNLDRDISARGWAHLLETFGGDEERLISAVLDLADLSPKPRVP